MLQYERECAFRSLQRGGFDCLAHDDAAVTELVAKRLQCHHLWKGPEIESC